MGLLNVGKKIGKVGVDFLVGGIKGFIKKPSIKTAVPAVVDVATMVIPAGKSVKLASKVGILQKLGSGASNMFKKLSTQTVKQKTMKIAGFGGAVALGSYATTGELPSPTLRTVAGYSAMQINPYGAIYGALSSGGKKIIESAQQNVPNIIDVINKQRNNVNDMGMSKMSDAERYADEIRKLIPNSMMPQQPNIYINGSTGTVPNINVQQPASSPAFSFSPSVSGSAGGMGDILPLLLLMGAGAGVAGYAIGRKRRKRKKKRYKKKESHK